jgi:hypothetical protein
MEKFNNPTNDEVQGVASDLVSEIIEPPRASLGYRPQCGRGSTIPPAWSSWVSQVPWLVRLLNPLGFTVGIAPSVEGAQ